MDGEDGGRDRDLETRRKDREEACGYPLGGLNLLLTLSWAVLLFLQELWLGSLAVASRHLLLPSLFYSMCGVNDTACILPTFVENWFGAFPFLPSCRTFLPSPSLVAFWVVKQTISCHHTTTQAPYTFLHVSSRDRRDRHVCCACVLHGILLPPLPLPLTPA